MILASMEYIDENDEQVPVIKKNNDKLSPISLTILDSVLDNKVTIIFSQGPLNLTSIISCLFAFQNKQDVLIGIPKRLFQEAYGSKNTRGKYTKIYFSLLYKKKINSMASHPFYFYRDMLWCKGKIDEEANELKELDISTYPEHGDLKNKKTYDSGIREKLKNGSFQNIPKIISIPIEGITPAGIIGEKAIIFKNEDYKLNKFNPKLIINESINERKYSFDNILKLIDKTENSDIKLVLHFSWPYLKGLSSFLRQIKDYNNVNVIHLGKRLCIESRKNFEKPSSNILPLSVEGELWDIYYAGRLSLNFKIILPASSINRKNPSIKDFEYWDWPFDERIKDIKEHLKYEELDKLEENVLKFPPVIDTFLCPSEIKRRTFLTENETWISLPINESFSIKTRSSNAVRVFTGLCSDIEKCRDLSYELRGLYTNSLITKKTLFQAYFIEIINQIIQKIVHDSNKAHKISVVIANLYPYLGTQTSLADSLIYLFKSIDKIKNFPNIINKENVVYIEKESDNGEKSKVIIWKDGSIQDENITNIKRLFSNTDPDIDVCVSKKDQHFGMTLKINLPIEYFQFNQQSSIIDRKHFKELVLYQAVVEGNGSFSEYKLSNISFERKLKNAIVKVEVECRNDRTHKKSVENEVQIVYTEPSKIQNLPRELIKNSELLIPGPIPFHTISDEEILISHGYDALLFPFKNVIFFAYPGMNFKRLVRQIKLYIDLLSENQTSISRRDLIFSLDHTKNIRRFKLPPKPKNGIQVDGVEIDTPIDTAIRDELLDDSNVDENEREEIKTLKDIWHSIQKKPLTSSPKFPFVHKTSKEQVDFCIEFENGAKPEPISFPIGMLIRKKRGDEYILSPIEELSENDTIIYIETDERESHENYLLRTLFDEDETSLEEILEPLTALKLFYNTLDIKARDDVIKMEKLYWLSSDEKQNLFNVIRILLDGEFLNPQNEFFSLVSNSIWQKFVKPERLIEIFSEGHRKLTYTKLYNLAKEMGLRSYKENSFKDLCSTAINEQKHYYFNDENNLLAIGRLIGNQRIIDDYQIINEKGKAIGTFLQQVGFSIKRVADGRSDPFNEMDIAIEEKMKKCKVVKIGPC